MTINHGWLFNLFEETDPDQVLTKILQAGVSIAETQDKHDALAQNTVAVDAYKAKVGQELTYVIPTPDQSNT